MTAQVLAGDCIEQLAALPSDSIDAVVTDPPYGLGTTTASDVSATIARWIAGGRDFVPGGTGLMGARWDSFVPPPAAWDEVFRVMRPGAHLAAFASPRTQDLMGLSIRLAGFELRDSLAWVNAQGMPKSRAIPGAPGCGTSLKPSHEPIILARKPLVGNVANTVAVHGTGALNIDDCRTQANDAAYARNCSGDRGHGNNRKRRMAFGTTAGHAHELGRFPGNVLLDEPQAAAIDTQRRGNSDRFTVIEQALDDLPSRAHYCAKAPRRERPEVGGTTHPSCKPLGLVRWLVRLVTPPGSTVLDPFAGSGTTMEAALLEGRHAIGIEREESYLPLIQQRLDRH